MTPQTTASFVAIIVALSGAYIAWRKYRPETNDITVTTADKVNMMTLRFAGDVSKDNDDLRGEIEELRSEFRQYRLDTESRLAELSVQVRAERAEKDRVKRENDELLGRLSRAESRVAELENEVARLKARP